MNKIEPHPFQETNQRIFAFILKEKKPAGFRARVMPTRQNIKGLKGNASLQEKIRTTGYENENVRQKKEHVGIYKIKKIKN